MAEEFDLTGDDLRDEIAALEGQLYVASIDADEMREQLAAARKVAAQLDADVFMDKRTPAEVWRDCLAVAKRNNVMLDCLYELAKQAWGEAETKRILDNAVAADGSGSRPESE